LYTPWMKFYIHAHTHRAPMCSRVGSPFLMSNDNGGVVANVKLRVPCHGFGSHDMSCESVHSDSKDSATTPKLRGATPHASYNFLQKAVPEPAKVTTKTSPSHTHTTTCFSVFTLHHGSCEQNKQTKAEQVNIPARDATAAPCLLFSRQTRNTPWFCCHLHKQQEFWCHLASVSFLFHQQNTPTSSSSPAGKHYKSILSAILGLTLLLLVGCNKVSLTCVQV